MIKWAIRFLGVAVAAGLIYYFYPEDRLPKDKNIDKIVVKKHKRTMEIYSAGKVIKTYKISLGQHPVGNKEFQGDKKTPEGQYFINDKNPKSAFHKNLGISYPNADNIQAAKEKNLDPGGDIKIHGIKNGFGFIGKFQRMIDWTAGCIGLTDQEIEELYDRVEIGTPIIIQP
jgi:murein L,D-transpeptidase YafK